MAPSTRTTSLSPVALVVISLLMPSLNFLKKPLLPSSVRRRVKSPSAAASTMAPISRSTATSSLRSRHSATEPTRVPASSLIGEAMSVKVRPPTDISVRCTPRRLPSRFRWWAGFRWKESKSMPMSLRASKFGSCLRMSASALISIAVTDLLR